MINKFASSNIVAVVSTSLYLHNSAIENNMSTVQEYNVFIFNNIENNAKDVERLCQTFSALSCKVCVVRNQSYENLLSIVDLIVEADFSRLNYIVIIILDNKNDSDNMWTTTDNRIFRLNNDLITAIKRNESLKGKLRFAILQNNRNFDTDLPKPIKEVAGATYYPGKDLTYYATSTGCSLNHTWDNNQQSDFIRILCDAIDQNVTTHYPITDLLKRVSDKVAEITGELPSKVSGFGEHYILGKATI